MSEGMRKEVTEKETQTEPGPGREDRMEAELDGMKAEIAEALTGLFNNI